MAERLRLWSGGTPVRDRVSAAEWQSASISWPGIGSCIVLRQAVSPQYAESPESGQPKRGPVPASRRRCEDHPERGVHALRLRRRDERRRRGHCRDPVLVERHHLFENNRGSDQ